MTIISKEWFITLALASQGWAGSLQFTLSPAEIRPGEHAELRLELLREAGDEEAPLVADEFLNQVPSLEVLERHLEKSNSHWRWTYDLTSYRPGTLRLPPIQVQTRRGNFSTEATVLTIQTVRPAGDNDLREDFGTVPNPWPWRRWGKFLLFTLLIAITFPLLVRLAQAIAWEKWKARFRWAPKQREETPRAWLQRSLRELRVRMENEGVRSEHLDELSWLVKHYYERRTQLPATSFTTDEFANLFQSQSVSQPLQRIFRRFDDYKFRPEKPALDFVPSSLNQIEELLLPHVATHR